MEYIPKYILVHHTAAETPNPQFADIDTWHRARNFALSSLGYYVGYHRVIEKDGSVQIARKDTERDCDALGHNFDSLSVCLVGNFDVALPTDAQMLALGAILSEWCRKWGLGADVIWPHRHFASKSCYGARLPDNWAKICYLEFEITRLKKELEDYAKPQ